MRFGIIGSGSWATALAKILTGNGIFLSWWIRNPTVIRHLETRHHNPQYLSSVYFDVSLLSLQPDVYRVIEQTDCIVVAVPSAFVCDALAGLPAGALASKKIISAVKGILPLQNLLLNDYLTKAFQFNQEDYFTVMGPCHAEEIAAEKLSYLTFSGIDEELAAEIAACFACPYVNTIVNGDVYGVQYAAVLKNVYAIAAGMAHGLEYGDNFLSVLIANCADEMAGFLRKAGISHMDVGVHGEPVRPAQKKRANYAASVYLGDLLVTCYSLFSRNRTFGNMIGKGYSVKSAQLELNMVAEGHNASKSLFMINRQIQAEMPIAEKIYQILWENVNVVKGFKQIEELLV